MNVLPVITRELRSEARHAFTYWLRVLGAGAVMAMAVFFVLLHGLRAQEGTQLFQQLHATLHLAIWLLVPLLTADCVSRERRERTLGLLFLTPLTALDIVLAKSLAHGLRALTLLLAVLPVVALPLLMGGVGGQQAASSLLINGGAILLALAAGLLASSLSTTWVRAMILSFLFAASFAFVFSGGLGMLFEWFFRPTRFEFGPRWLEQGVQLAVGTNPSFFISTYYYRSGLAAVPGMTMTPVFQAVLLAAFGTFFLSVVVLAVSALCAAGFTGRSRRERSPNAVLTAVEQRLCTPVLMRAVLERWMRRNLERNPIGWLERRTWSGRLVIWGWLAVMISLYSLALTDANFFSRSAGALHALMGWILLGSMAVNASTSFRRERELRVLELLLVSPLNEAQILLGRLRGIWGQFLPSIAVLLGGWTYLSLVFRSWGEITSDLLFFAVSFATVPVIGLYFSLVCRNFLTAILWTAVVGLVLPGSLLTIVRALFSIVRGAVVLNLAGFEVLLHPVAIQIVLAGLIYSHLHQRLVQRRFATETT